MRIQASKFVVIFPEGSTTNTINEFIAERKIEETIRKHYMYHGRLAVWFHSAIKKQVSIDGYLSAGYEFLTGDRMIEIVTNSQAVTNVSHNSHCETHVVENYTQTQPDTQPNINDLKEEIMKCINDITNFQTEMYEELFRLREEVQGLRLKVDKNDQKGRFEEMMVSYADDKGQGRKSFQLGARP
jgi:hypothetical protein